MTLKRGTLDDSNKAMLLSSLKHVLKNTPLLSSKTEKKHEELSSPTPSKLEFSSSSGVVDIDAEIEAAESKYFAADFESQVKARETILDSKEKVIFENESEDESHLESYVKWAELRQILFPYSDMNPI